ncbi:uncharacterized protein DAT39_022947 [Clarias magur]|uniref:Uncharacterized protein n=1 Tax=Clarias magur TaxID=1594786 RepID=A0A8J4X7J2_CLAMG|nr:uncharacterized protein DAT39_022947 [Clarias magur]
MTVGNGITEGNKITVGNRITEGNKITVGNGITVGNEITEGNRITIKNEITVLGSYRGERDMGERDYCEGENRITGEGTDVQEREQIL